MLLHVMSSYKKILALKKPIGQTSIKSGFLNSKPRLLKGKINVYFEFIYTIKNKLDQNGHLKESVILRLGHQRQHQKNLSVYDI